MLRYAIAQPYFPPADIEAILAQFRTILEGQCFLSMGDRVVEFENAFARYAGAPYAVGTSSCSAALEIAFRAIGIENGDEVIVPAETFIATGSSVLREGGTVVFAEINPETFCLSAGDVEEKLTGKTKAVVIVHMAGLITPEVHAIRQLCNSRGIFLIEDAAHAPGAMLNGRKAGTFGDIACFSFYPTKVMTTAEGGMLVTSIPEFYDKAKSLRNRGVQYEHGREVYRFLGSNNRMNEFAAILGLSQLRQLDGFIEKRNRIAAIYTDALLSDHGREHAWPLKCPAEARHSYWRYIVRLSDVINRDELRASMLAEGVAIDWAYDPPLHLQPLFVDRYKTQPGMLPVTESAMQHFVCLPMHVCLEQDDAEFIVQAFKRCIEKIVE